MFRTILLGTLVAGTLDILAAIGLTLFYGRRTVAEMLGYVASGPFPGAADWAATGAALGLAVHFVLMAMMVAAYVFAASRIPALPAKPVQWGLIYGLVTFAAMNLVVVPLRFGGAFPPPTRVIVTQLFCHIVLVGIPIALIAARYLKNRPLGN